MRAQEQLDYYFDLLALATKTGYPRFDSLLMIAELVRTFKPKRLLELGTMYGCSSIFIANAMPEDATLLCIDSFNYQPLEEVAKTIASFGGAQKVSLMQADTCTVGSKLAGRKFDFVLFDASHTDEGLLREYHSVRPFLEHKALLVVDDALCVPAALAKIGEQNLGMKAYPAHYGLCAVVHP